MAYFADSLPDTGVTAKDNLRFQEYMSDTAHQREMEDLRRAGLNPVLAAGSSGASVPSGGQDSTETLQLLSGLTELVEAASGDGSAKKNMEEAEEENNGLKLDKDSFILIARAAGLNYNQAQLAWLAYEKYGSWTINQFRNFSSAKDKNRYYQNGVAKHNTFTWNGQEYEIPAGMTFIEAFNKVRGYYKKRHRYAGVQE